MMDFSFELKGLTHGMKEVGPNITRFLFLAASVNFTEIPDLDHVHWSPAVTRTITAKIVLRAYDENRDLIRVIEFQGFTKGHPYLAVLKEQKPTPADRAYIKALKELEIKQVDVDGRAA